MASQITDNSTVCSIVYTGALQRKHKSSASLVFVRWPVDSPHKGPVTRKRPPLVDVIMIRHLPVKPRKVLGLRLKLSDRCKIWRASVKLSSNNPLSRLRDFPRSNDKTSYAMLKHTRNISTVINYIMFSSLITQYVICGHFTAADQRTRKKHTCQITLHISGSPIEIQWDSRNILGQQQAAGCGHEKHIYFAI